MASFLHPKTMLWSSEFIAQMGETEDWIFGEDIATLYFQEGLLL